MTIASTERMSTVRVIILFLSTTFCFYLFHTLIRFLHKVWWKPTRLQTLMSSQGIRGPSYRFPHGNTKQISNMRSQSMEKPMDISHDIFTRIQPHVCAWTKAYGKMKYFQDSFILSIHLNALTSDSFILSIHLPHQIAMTILSF
ncbi:hypothetical protein ACS0TY_008204 [Phlomoides rotata]